MIFSECFFLSCFLNNNYHIYEWCAITFFIFIMDITPDRIKIGNNFSINDIYESGKFTTKDSESKNKFINSFEWEPQNSSMVKFSKRLNSFKHWSKQIKQRPLELALSGFYSCSYGDFVHCFYCGIVIHQWDIWDDINFEHYRHSPNCKFLSMIWGKIDDSFSTYGTIL